MRLIAYISRIVHEIPICILDCQKEIEKPESVTDMVKQKVWVFAEKLVVNLRILIMPKTDG